MVEVNPSLFSVVLVKDDLLHPKALLLGEVCLIDGVLPQKNTEFVHLQVLSVGQTNTT